MLLISAGFAMLGKWGKIFQVLPERPSIASAFMITPKFSMQAIFELFTIAHTASATLHLYACSM
jgi:hypothetical protein